MPLNTPVNAVLPLISTPRLGSYIVTFKPVTDHELYGTYVWSQLAGGGSFYKAWKLPYAMQSTVKHEDASVTNGGIALISIAEGTLYRQHFMERFSELLVTLMTHGRKNEGKISDRLIRCHNGATIKLLLQQTLVRGISS